MGDDVQFSVALWYSCLREDTNNTSAPGYLRTRSSVGRRIFRFYDIYANCESIMKKYVWEIAGRYHIVVVQHGGEETKKVSFFLMYILFFSPQIPGPLGPSLKKEEMERFLSFCVPCRHRNTGSIDQHDVMTSWKTSWKTDVFSRQACHPPRPSRTMANVGETRSRRKDLSRSWYELVSPLPQRAQTVLKKPTPVIDEGTESSGEAQSDNDPGLCEHSCCDHVPVRVASGVDHRHLCID